MTRQAHTQKGRMLNPFKTVLLISALLMFVFTVVYRMVKSASFSNALATLVESLLIVFFFIFFGILLAYLLYFVYQKFRQGSDRQHDYKNFGRNPCGSRSPVRAFLTEDSQGKHSYPLQILRFKFAMTVFIETVMFPKHFFQKFRYETHWPTSLPHFGQQNSSARPVWSSYVFAGFKDLLKFALSDVVAGVAERFCEWRPGA